MTNPSAREALAELIAAWDAFNGKSIPESLYAAIDNARAALATAPAEPPHIHTIQCAAKGCAISSWQWDMRTDPSKGWICPACKRVNAPLVRECACRGNLTLGERLRRANR